MGDNENSNSKDNAKKCGLLFNSLLTILVLSISFTHWLFKDVSNNEKIKNITDLFGEFSLLNEMFYCFF